MSVVWRGHDKLPGRPAPIKVLSPELAADRYFRDRIRHEAMACGRLSHPNIVSVYDYGEAVEPDGTTVPYLVMELVEGGSLAERLAAGPLPWPLGLQVCAEVAAALAAAHEIGLVHRDVSPANVLMSRTGAKVVDFGISAVAGVRESKAPVLGTPAYLAPERLSGTPAVPATDVYALGVMLFQVLTGALPWSAETAAQVLAQHRHADPAPLPPVPGLPPHLAALYHQCLAKQPGSRPASADVAQRLAAVIGPRIAVPAAPATTPRTVPRTALLQPETTEIRRPWRARNLVVAAIAVVLAVLAGLILGPPAGPDGGPPAGPDGGPLAGPDNGTDGEPAAGGQPSATGDTGSPASGCTVRYRVRSDWEVGFTVEVTLTNTGDTPLSPWVLTFSFPDDQRVVQGWNGSFAQSGSKVTVRSVDYNARLTPAGSATLGFNGAYQAQNGTPQSFTLNGVTCTAESD
jgi:serine/threonine-protein kinase